MLAIILCMFRFVRLLGSGHQAVAVENLALRLQLAAYKRKRKRPMLTLLDRLFWVGLSQVWSDWRHALVFVQPDTVVRWQRERFRRFWARLSRPKGPRRGRPAVASEIRRLVRQMAIANPLWRAPRIHGELKMLGITISERTVSRILLTVPRPPSQTWKTFLRNHLGQIVSVDFFIIPTIRLRVLFVFLVLEHRRREVLRFNVTEHPTSAWVAQQIVEAFADRETPRYLIRDRDGVYGTEVPRASEVDGYCRGADSASKPLAERLRRALDRIDTTGMFESFHHSEQSELKEGAGFVFRLLPPITPTSGAQQTMPN